MTSHWKKLAILFTVIASIGIFDVISELISGEASATGGRMLVSREASRAEDPQAFRELVTYQWMRSLGYVVPAIIFWFVHIRECEAEDAAMAVVDQWLKKDNPTEEKIP